MLDNINMSNTGDTWEKVAIRKQGLVRSRQPPSRQCFMLPQHVFCLLKVPQCLCVTPEKFKCCSRSKLKATQWETPTKAVKTRITWLVRSHTKLPSECGCCKPAPLWSRLAQRTLDSERNITKSRTVPSATQSLQLHRLHSEQLLTKPRTFTRQPQGHAMSSVCVCARTPAHPRHPQPQPPAAARPRSAPRAAAGPRRSPAARSPGAPPGADRASRGGGAGGGSAAQCAARSPPAAPASQSRSPRRPGPAPPAPVPFPPAEHAHDPEQQRGGGRPAVGAERQRFGAHSPSLLLAPLRRRGAKFCPSSRSVRERRPAGRPPRPPRARGLGLAAPS